MLAHLLALAFLRSLCSRNPRASCAAEPGALSLHAGHCPWGHGTGMGATNAHTELLHRKADCSLQD